MTLELAYNTTDTMAVVDADSRSIGGREWGVVDTAADPVKRLLDSGDLILANEDSARAAKLPIIAVLDERRERAAQAKALDVDKLREAVGDPDGNKAELVREAAADTSVELPPAPKAKSGRAGDSGN